MKWTRKDQYAASAAAAIPVASAFFPAVAGVCKGDCLACGGCVGIVMGGLVAGSGLVSAVKKRKAENKAAT